MHKSVSSYFYHTYCKFPKFDVFFLLFLGTAGILPNDFNVGFRGNSCLDDGKDGEIDADLVGGYYDSGNNIKFSFSTAYTVTLLSWTVIEYQEKYAEIEELNHVKDIIKWGSEYLLKLFIPPNSTSDHSTLYSQVSFDLLHDYVENKKCF